jgi:hypothetical protein
MADDMLPGPVAATLLVVDALEDFEVPYFLSGSLASPVHGVVRTTAERG